MELTILLFLFLNNFKVFNNKRLTALSSFTWITAIISLQITMLCFFPCPLQLTPLGPVTSKITQTTSPFYREPYQSSYFSQCKKKKKNKVCATAYKVLYHLISLPSFLSTNYSSLTLCSYYRRSFLFPKKCQDNTFILRSDKWYENTQIDY